MISKAVRPVMAVMERHISIGENMGTPACALRNQKGFTYIGVLIVLAVMLVAMGSAAQVWHTVMQRENEQELLFIGHQFRKAIAQYYVKTGNRYPPSLEVLLESADMSGRRVHYLRKIYRDPMTGDNKWGLVLGLNAAVTGVYSLSREKPIKVSGFSDADAKFEKAETYSDWKFVFIPQPVGVQNLKGTVVNGIARPAPRPSNFVNPNEMMKSIDMLNNSNTSP